MVAAMPLAAADAADAPRAKPGAAPQQHVRHLPHPANGAPDAPKQQPQQHSQQQQSLQQQLPHPAAFAGSVILVRSPQGCLRTDLSPAADAHGSIPVHGGISAETAFDTDLFSGKIRVIFKMPPEVQAPRVTELLAGKKRQMWLCIQGRLKRPVAVDQLEYGSFFSRGLRLPAPLILGPAIHFLSSRLGSGLHMQLRGDRPHVTGPLAAAVQMLNVSRVGQEPDLLGAEEDTRMLFRAGEEHADAPMASGQRRSFFRRASARAGRVFTPDMVLTFHCYDHSFDYNAFRMSVPPCFSIDMVKTLDAQPVDVSMRDKASGEWVARFQVWHRRMLPTAHARLLSLQRERLRAAKRDAGAGGGGERDSSDSDWREDDGGGGSGSGSGLGSADTAGASYLSELSAAGAYALESYADMLAAAAAGVVAHAIECGSEEEEEEEAAAGGAASLGGASGSSSSSGSEEGVGEAALLMAVSKR